MSEKNDFWLKVLNFFGRKVVLSILALGVIIVMVSLIMSIQAGLRRGREVRFMWGMVEMGANATSCPTDISLCTCTPFPTYTPYPTYTPFPSVTSAEIPVIFEDDFTNNLNGWLNYVAGFGGWLNLVSSFDAQEVAIVNGQLRIAPSAESVSSFYEDGGSGAGLVVPVPEVRVKNFCISFDSILKEISHPESTAVVVIFRATCPNRYYAAFFFANSTFSVVLYNGGPVSQLDEKPLFSHQYTRFIHKGEAYNHFEVCVHASEIFVYANNHLLATVADRNILGEGDLAIGLLPSVDGAVLLVDNLVVTEFSDDK